MISSRQLKTACFVLAGLNTYAGTVFLFYLFFLLRDRFGFGNRENLWISAMHGFIYMFAAWQCGRFAERRGFLTSLKVGFSGLTLLMIAGALLHRYVAGILCVVVLYSVVLLFTWPALEALVSQNETRAGVQHNVGVYNCTWAASAAIAYFTGGPLYDRLGPVAVFWIPGAIFFAEFLFATWLARHTRAEAAPPQAETAPEPAPAPEAAAFHQPVPPRRFLQMAWLANPFAYVAVNTLLAVMPGIAVKHSLSPTDVGLFCSVWFFARLAAFGFLWKWSGWHYRFRWLLGAFVALIAGFLTVLLAPHLWVVVLAQVFFGVGAGQIYYSSLFYSMDVGETKGEHGGLHEAAIGAGVFVGPGVGAAALQFAPNHANVGVYAVGGLLLCGLTALVWLRAKSGAKRGTPQAGGPAAIRQKT